MELLPVEVRFHLLLPCHVVYGRHHIIACAGLPVILTHKLPAGSSADPIQSSMHRCCFLTEMASPPLHHPRLSFQKTLSTAALQLCELPNYVSVIQVRLELRADL